MSQFDQALIDTVNSTLASPFVANIQSVTVIRDLWGKIRLVISVGDRDRVPDATSRRDFNARMAAQLGSYWRQTTWFEEDSKDKAFQAAKAQIEAQRVVWHPEGYTGPIQWHKLERRYSKSSWLQSPRQPAWVLDTTNNPDETAIVSFYSFKGGVGRSTALAAVAMLLSAAGKSVCVLDLDLESPGISTFLLGGAPGAEGILDYLIDAQVTNTRPNLAAYLSLLQTGNASIRVMGAGALNVGYLEKLARLDFDSYTRDENSPHPLKKLLLHIHDEYQPDFILLDVRAGLHDLGGLSINGLSHLDIIFARNDSQSKAGLETLLNLVGPQPAERDIFLVHAQVPQPNNSAELYDRDWHDAFREHAFDLFGRFYFGPQDQQPDIADEEAPYGIPVPFLPALQRVANPDELMRYARDEQNGFVKLARMLGTYLAKETI